MKRTFFLVLLTTFHLLLHAQHTGARINESTLVKDSSGTVYPAVIWRALLFQGNYDLRPVDGRDEHSAFILVRLTEEQRARRYESMPKPIESQFFRTGKDLSSFKTTDINHNKINLKEERGKIVVLNFWFVNCPPCRMEIPALNELVETYKDNPTVHFIGIALDSKNDLKDFLKTSPFNYNIIHDGRFIADQYGVRAYPTHVVIDQQGKVHFHTTGLAMNTVYWLKKSIAELLSQPPVAQR